MRETSGELNNANGLGGETAIVASDRENRRIVLDLEDVRRLCDAVYADWEKGPVVPKLELTAEQIESIRGKMETRGFDRLLWVRGGGELPTAKTIIEKAIIDKNGPPPEFFGRMSVENIDELKEDRPDRDYLLLTRTGEAEPWTRGKNPEEILVLLRRLGERGLTLREYLLLDNMRNRSRTADRTRPESLRTIGEYLLGSSLPEGGVVAVSRGAAGDLSITSAGPAQEHPEFGARGALVIPLEGAPKTGR